MAGRGHAGAWAVVALSIATAVPAGAQTGHTGTEEAAAAREEARRHFELGGDLMVNEDWEAAAAEFQRSLDLFPTRSALFNLAMCRKALHSYREAVALFERWRSEFSEAATAEERERVDAVIEDLGRFLGELSVSVSVEGASLRVDGEPLGTSPLSGPVVMNVGPHRLETALEGYVTDVRELMILSRERADVVVALVPIRPFVAIEETPPSDSPIAIDPGLPTETGVSSIWFWTTAGTAVALAVGGAATGGLALAAEDDFNAALGPCRSGDESACDRGNAAADDIDAYELATNVLLPAAGALAAAAVALAVFTEFGGAEPVETGPNVVAGPGGLLLDIRF